MVVQACLLLLLNFLHPRIADIAPPDQWTIPHDASYLYYCDNETVYGVEFADVPDSQGRSILFDTTLGSNRLSTWLVQRRRQDAGG